MAAGHRGVSQWLSEEHGPASQCSEVWALSQEDALVLLNAVGAAQ